MRITPAHGCLYNICASIEHHGSASCVRSSPSEDASLPQPITSTQWEFVDTVLNLEAVAKDIKVAAQIAVDLEHHAVRSYLGITCLLQISTGMHSHLTGEMCMHALHVPLLCICLHCDIKLF